MTDHHITASVAVTPAQAKDVAEIAQIIALQEARLAAIDPRLRSPRSADQIAATLAEQCAAEEPSLVARNSQGNVRGYVAPAVWELETASTLLSVFARRNGIARWLTLPPPDAPDVDAVLDALLTALNAWWTARRTDGAILTWPVHDLTLVDAAFVAHGFRRDTALALRPLGALPPPRHAPPSDLVIRPARVDDEAALTALAIEEMAFHEAFTPFSRVQPTLVPSFQSKLARALAGEPDAPFFLVAERAGTIVGMAENTVEDYTQRASILPPFCYGCIYNFVVRADARGQGIGQMLVDASLQALEQRQVAMHYLYFVVDNPLSSRFWPRLGFAPLAITYQRRTTLQP
jgi:ribosomal protein S18 acetylase RimI-like enzyme